MRDTIAEQTDWFLRIVAVGSIVVGTITTIFTWLFVKAKLDAYNIYGKIIISAIIALSLFYFCLIIFNTARYLYRRFGKKGNFDTSVNSKSITGNEKIIEKYGPTTESTYLKINIHNHNWEIIEENNINLHLFKVTENEQPLEPIFPNRRSRSRDITKSYILKYGIIEKNLPSYDYVLAVSFKKPVVDLSPAHEFRQRVDENTLGEKLPLINMKMANYNMSILHFTTSVSGELTLKFQ